jgi:hypothetical protein
LLAAVLLALLALLAWLVRPYLPHLEDRLADQARNRALSLSVRQPLDLQQARVATLAQHNEDLRLELARLTDELAHKGGDCAAGLIGPGGIIVGVVPGGPIERVPGTDDKSIGLKAPDEKNVADAASKDKGPDEKGAGNKGPDAPGDKDKGNGQDKQADAPKPMVVPPEAKKNQDLGFLKGDWKSRTGLATAQGEKDLRPNYTLDDKGKGKVSFVQKNGASCEAPAEARWDSGKLVIEEKSNPKCSDGRTYARNVVNCDVGPDGAAQCKGSQPGDTKTYNVQIGH